ncbi:MAG: glycosyltransferase [Gammaproteobacteria bacterium]|nr:MAG: glycosyltransferase [Gammaproteobacteria bacterium]
MPKNDKPHLSIVTPVYGCPDCLPQLYERLVKAITPITENFEIIMVNDACPAGSWEHIVKIANSDSRVKGINLSRNFGQHHAITAGLDHTSGDWVVVMDCDLQDRPEEIPKLYRKAQEGYEIVFGQRIARQDDFLKKLGSKVFYRMLSYLTDQDFDASIANFSISSEKVILQLRQMREQVRMFPLFLLWMGFKTAKIEIEHAERAEGKSAYSLRRLVNLAGNIVVAHSNKPLRLSIGFGFAISLLSFIYGAFLITRYFFMDMPVEGWTSVMVSIYFVAGLLLANMGVLGLYIGKVFDEGKRRPIYVVGQTLNFE